MSKNSIKISYNKESDVLSIKAKEGRSVDSDIQGNIVIDYNKKGEIVQLNLYKLNFDKFREELRAVKDFARSSKLPFVAR